ncbi:hypothetical protein BST63_00960 [Bradyrhizobium canariense]|uniref:Uncharacterized protein n=2 Tax=Bradyrhizobium canariense TaxID=255045 RepID=A0ABX3XBF5_9BRAD|nr:hypothetical protein BSR47_00990 [Bradyrhizobium canariense]OSJ36035.1 hypothetical protein BST63_00960 [Bradyrhizobium canariense]
MFSPAGLPKGIEPMLFGNVIATLDASRFLRSVKGARIALYVGDDLIAKLENPIVFQSFNAVANALDSGCKTSNPMPRHLGACGINHDYDHARMSGRPAPVKNDRVSSPAAVKFNGGMVAQYAQCC